MPPQLNLCSNMKPTLLKINASIMTQITDYLPSTYCNVQSSGSIVMEKIRFSQKFHDFHEHLFFSHLHKPITPENP